jgi:hypothetical protein
LPGGLEQVLLWTQVVTGMELDQEGVFQVLDGATWQRRCQRLEELGGPPYLERGFPPRIVDTPIVIKTEGRQPAEQFP